MGCWLEYPQHALIGAVNKLGNALAEPAGQAVVDAGADAGGHHRVHHFMGDNAVVIEPGEPSG